MLFVAVAFSAACSAVALAISHLNDSTILDGCIIQPLHQCNLHADLLPRPEQLKVSTQSATAFPASCRRTRAPSAGVSVRIGSMAAAIKASTFGRAAQRRAHLYTSNAASTHAQGTLEMYPRDVTRFHQSYKIALRATTLSPTWFLLDWSCCSR